jgi:hypothetical protein
MTFSVPTGLVRRLFLLMVLLSTTFLVKAQKYRTAFGGRLARPDVGITLTQRVAEQTTLELLGTAAHDDLTLTLLARQHSGFLVDKWRALNFYAGIGPHIGNTQDRGNYVGGTLVLGGEWKIPIFPLVIAYDWMPAISSSNRERRFNNSTGVSVRYVIIKEKKNGVFRKLFGGQKDR